MIGARCLCALLFPWYASSKRVVWDGETLDVAINKHSSSSLTQEDMLEVERANSTSIPLEILTAIKTELNEQCVVAHAYEFEKSFPAVECGDHVPNNHSNGSLSDIVATYFINEAELSRTTGAPAVWRRERHRVHDEIKQGVKQRCFSITYAMKHCESERFREMLLPLVSNCIADNIGNEALKENFAKYVELKRKLTIWTWAAWGSIWPEGAMPKAAVSTRITGLRKTLGANGYRQLKEKCHANALRETSLSEDTLISRMVKEVKMCKKVHGTTARSDSSENPCPEATHCQSRRKERPERGLAVGTATLALSFPVFVAVGALIGGFLIPGIGAAEGAAAGAACPGNTPISLAFGALASREIFPSWLCFPSDCEWQPINQRCGINSESSNPFRWLPSPGQKCVRSEQGGESCEMRACANHDYEGNMNMSDYRLFGTVGVVDVGVFNCLSHDGTAPGGLEYMASLPSGNENTPPNRIEFYRELERVRGLGGTDGVSVPDGKEFIES